MFSFLLDVQADWSYSLYMTTRQTPLPASTFQAINSELVRADERLARAERNPEAGIVDSLSDDGLEDAMLIIADRLGLSVEDQLAIGRMLAART